MNEAGLKSFGGMITTVMNGGNLSRDEAEQAWREIIADEQPELQQGAFMAALSMKGETEQEIAGTWKAIYELDTAKVDLSHIEPLVENCGTGMDRLKTFNISTIASIVAAAGGVSMAKHGARALTSQCGTVDVLEQLGIDVEAPVEVVKQSVEQCGIGLFNGMSGETHPAALFRILSQIRFGSTLNIAGSLANPANPQYGVRGVFSPDVLKQTVETMREIGYKRALVFHGYDSEGNPGIDELSTMGNSLIYELDEKGSVHKYSITPEELGLSRARYEDLATAGSAADAAKIVLRVLNGSATVAQREIVLLNAAPILLVAGVVETLQEGVVKAAELLNSGAALETLRAWVTAQNRDAAKGIAQFESLLEVAR